MLAGGRIVQLTTVNGSEKVKLSLEDKELRWESAGFVRPRKYTATVSKFDRVVKGKSEFRNQAMVKDFDDELCFSLMAWSSDVNVDIQVATKAERDIIAIGLEEFITDLKSAGP
jgi:hypothetical protein